MLPLGFRWLRHRTLATLSLLLHLAGQPHLPQQQDNMHLMVTLLKRRYSFCHRAPAAEAKEPPHSRLKIILF